MYICVDFVAETLLIRLGPCLALPSTGILHLRASISKSNGGYPNRHPSQKKSGITYVHGCYRGRRSRLPLLLRLVSNFDLGEESAQEAFTAAVEWRYRIEHRGHDRRCKCLIIVGVPSRAQFAAMAQFILRWSRPVATKGRVV